MSDDDPDDVEEKFLRSRAIRSMLAALIGVVLCFSVFGINLVALLTGPMAITMASRVLKVAKGDHLRAPRILAWVAISIAVISLVRPLLF